MNNNFDINVLVNGNRCKFYYHQGKTFIEAKDNSEYELEIKNNTWERVLCLASVDGLNVLNGEVATDNGIGYIIPAYSPLRIKGFRYSSDEVAAFKFTSKENSYAHSQGGNELSKNCGVIGFKLYNETSTMSNITLSSTIFNNVVYKYPINNYEITSTTNYSCESTYNSGIQESIYNCSLQSFDMGSTWGKKINSKVVEAEFNKGYLILSLDVYYASRLSLQQMGVKLDNVTEINFPQSFPQKFASPPKNWNG